MSDRSQSGRGRVEEARRPYETRDSDARDRQGRRVALCARRQAQESFGSDLELAGRDIIGGKLKVFYQICW